MGWVTKEQTLKAIKVLVLGDYGTGKSYFASTFPEPLFLIDFDRGALGYAGRKVYVPDYIYSWETRAQEVFANLEKDLDLLIRGEHPEGQFSTVVLDSLTTATKAAMDMACELRPLAPNTPPVWNVHYPLVKVIMDRILDRLRRLPCHVVVIGHVNYDKNDLTGEIVASPAITGNLKTYIPAIFDEVYFAETVRDRQGTKYVLHLSPVGFKRARSRLRSLNPAIPEVLPNDFNALMQYLQNQS